MENTTSCNASPSEPSEKPPTSESNNLGDNRESNTELMNYFHGGTMNNKVTALDNVFDDPSPMPIADPHPPPPSVAEESSSAKVEETTTVYGSMTEACGCPTEKLEIKEDCEDDKNKGKKRERGEKPESQRTEFCTPSYALIEGAREEHEYLNTTCKIVYRLKETKPKEKSDLNKCMDRIEDHIFETDMCRKRLEATIEKAKSLHKKAMMALPLKDGDSFSALELITIKSVFPREGERIVEAMRSNPKVALPVVIEFLEEKRDQARYMLSHVLKFEKSKTFNELSSKEKEE